MIYKTRKEYIERLALLRWMSFNAVTTTGKDSIRREYLGTKQDNGPHWGAVDRFVEVRYREYRRSSQN